mmetsp:Transcript_10115/g.22754  ORF Transcript_10115/g.22754 Transcript_10115/m.22754 type:complete len:262 (+) Transcript_10115:76-861(+)
MPFPNFNLGMSVLRNTAAVGRARLMNAFPKSAENSTLASMRGFMGARRAQSTAAASMEAPAAEATKGFSYIAFAKAYPFTNNVIIATLKTSAADLVAQTVIEKKSLKEVDWQRNSVFCLFGACYLGGFQYFYQITVFKRLFPGMERFTNQTVMEKIKDVPGIAALAAQTVLDVAMLDFVYLPTFYVFKAFVFSKVWDVQEWISTGLSNYTNNLRKDSWDVLRVWAPADIVCFSVPLWLRLPVRHVVSFVWTAYLSFVRGSK